MLFIYFKQKKIFFYIDEKYVSKIYLYNNLFIYFKIYNLILLNKILIFSPFFLK
jgi:hypothetical protein